MQFPQSLNRTQLSLFEAFVASALPSAKAESPRNPWLEDALRFDDNGVFTTPQPVEETPAFSEIVLRGAAGNCLSLLAPILRELSDNQDKRWLTLIAPPSSLTQNWLREAGLNRERILLLHPRGEQSPLQLAQHALELGRSHTVVSWLNPLEPKARQTLEQAAQQGQAQSLNISLG
ncbi:SOS-induced cell division inhibitor SulA [Pseudomonas xionganensis]|uniref:CDP-glycerol--UDP-pyrophosphoryl-N-acetylglucosaminyl-N-acetylmannosamine glycerophosphotransferase n=1 Tax=Pseudomonas xionganensis TaxID=2654845 RepID=A0A6I4L2A1_9PSED|nr:SOS-induced cell division inhibitor SulA [Pseudomonas xionganensis]MVW76103.1 CDP-glycerol--UDP-pyrophosphoryl-N-acetylglucosaminyl-N-acetylmannosamine glycerophosphotransferase [Pseudomonas xionganensis]